MAPEGQLHDESLPGTVHSGQLSDANQRLFYKKWAELMDAQNWAEVPLSPSTMAAAQAAE
jgi:ethylbenzene dioxygenase alpha subunit